MYPDAVPLLMHCVRKVTVNPAPQGAIAEINFEATNTSGSLVLHWGALRPDRG
jgi:alpha-glucan,water dikinase